VILIVYTTQYREGGDKFERVARTMAAEKAAEHGTDRVRSVAVESKAEFVAAVQGASGLTELHFIGHSGMYGPMFRTTKMPEQFSPHEWRTLRIPFASGATAHFHACRTARWFAPFFARTFNVPTFGYHWYTTVSTRRDRFRWEGPRRQRRPDAPLYVMGYPGRKSHGLPGAVGKYLHGRGVEAMKRFEPEPVQGDSSYDSVADLYDAVFTDITVRRDEWDWLMEHLPETPGRALDIGCGNGVLLRQLRAAGRITGGAGVDASKRMVELARQHAVKEGSDGVLEFATVDGPELPFPDASFDCVTSLLSFRYLDWDPLMNEIRRVLKPGGRILIVDMVTVPVGAKELPRFLASKLKVLAGALRRREFSRALARLVSDPRWATMLVYNPIRAEHEMRWYLESRYPPQRVETLNVGWNARVLAFDSGPLQPGYVAPQSYP
jgi:ubiquinone/menaquinone biosynthesis C-methylase UbiE